MWIRTQENKLVNLDNVKYIDVESEELIDMICAYFNDNTECFLGIYENEERALEVLEELQKRIIIGELNGVTIEEMKKDYAQGKMTIEHLTSIIEKFVIVYEMPKE